MPCLVSEITSRFPFGTLNRGTSGTEAVIALTATRMTNDRDNDPYM